MAARGGHQRQRRTCEPMAQGYTWQNAAGRACGTSQRRCVCVFVFAPSSASSQLRHCASTMVPLSAGDAIHREDDVAPPAPLVDPSHGALIVTRASLRLAALRCAVNQNEGQSAVWTSQWSSRRRGRQRSAQSIGTRSSSGCADLGHTGWLGVCCAAVDARSERPWRAVTAITDAVSVRACHLDSSLSKQPK